MYPIKASRIRRPERSVWLSAACVAATVSVLVSGGCASQASKVELPSLEKDKRQLMTKDEQKNAASALGKKMDAEAAAAKAKIEAAK